MKKIRNLIFITIIIFSLTGCGGKSYKNSMLKVLKKENYQCRDTSDGIECSIEDSKQKKTFLIDATTINYEEIIYDEGTVRLVINIDNTKYKDAKDSSGTSHYSGIINAYFKGEDVIEFYPENCTDKIDCHLHFGEKVYPELKERYDEYKEYFASGKDKEYFRLKNKYNKSLSDGYEEFGLRITFDNNSEIKDKDQFTDNVNDALRFYEKILEEAGIKLEK